MRLGFLGTGVIAEAVIMGLIKTAPDVEEILVSPRNEKVAARLSSQFKEVRIAEDNCGVVAADLVFLAVRPQIAEEIIRPLNFHQCKKIVSFLAGISIESLTVWTKTSVPIIRAIPLPFVAALQGATVIYPPDPEVSRLFAGLGTAVEVESLDEFNLLAVASALMGNYFGLIEANARWLESHGLPRKQADSYLRQLHAGLADAMMAKPDTSFDDLRLEFSTPQGLNEQVYQGFSTSGGHLAMSQALDAVFKRILSA